MEKSSDLSSSKLSGRDQACEHDIAWASALDYAPRKQFVF